MSDNADIFKEALQDAEPWIAANVPGDYTLDKGGVWLTPPPKRNGDPRPPEYICGPCWLAAFTRKSTNEDWGSIVCWCDRDGQFHKRSIPIARFHEPGNALAQELAAAGLAIEPGAENKIAKYLGRFKINSRQQSVDKLGWVDSTTGDLCYVFPTATLRQGQGEEIVFQPEKYSPTTVTMTAAGSLKEWQDNVAAQCAGQPFLIFALCVAFAGPLLKHARLDSCAFNYYGRSTHGKTTAAQVAASIWGCGADPADAPELAFIRGWNSTANALEGLAAAHTDNVLILDELGRCSARDFGSVVYNILGGQGKNACDTSRNLKKARSWRILLFSTGEVSIQQKIEEE